ncbi:hypothetical protein EHS15_12170 [Leptospira idonii]|uniref:Uncharacterized protein n=2 Tax=Leptospira idonii TaxID=1193500 RepID=A0A4R9LXM1_9LEPT|nr:hypothetical protein EHS15_12170 [Leptospira idonii]
MEPFDPNSFMNQIKLKEAFFLMKQGEEADQDTVDRLISQILPKSDSGFTMILRIVGEKLQVLSNDFGLEELSPVGKMAFRGGSIQQFKLNRTLEGKEIQFILSPNQENSEIYLSVEINPPAAYKAKLKLDGDTIETLNNLQKEKMFDSPITMETSSEVVFLEENKEIGRFHLVLQESFS